MISAFTRPTSSLRSLFLTAFIVSVSFAAASAQEPTPKEDGEAQIERLEQLHREGLEDETQKVKKEDPNRREEGFFFQRRYPYDMIPAGARVEALRDVRSFELKLDRVKKNSGDISLFADNVWQGIGPANVGGRVRALAIDPKNSQTIFIGAAAGGVWKTTDGGGTWKTTFDRQSALTMGAIAIDPTNSNVIYVGTGELRPAVDITYLSDGVFKSTDGGETWKNIGLNSLGAFSRIAVHRSNPKIVYAAAGRPSLQLGRNEISKTGGGFYRSTDAGETWKKTFDGVNFDMVVNPSNSDEVFITTANSVHRSTDAGVTFTQASSGITAGGARRTSIAISASNPLILYVLMARPSGNENNYFGDVYRTTNSGSSWTLVQTLGEEFFRGQGDYNNCIAIHPTNPDIVLAGGIEIYRTEDGGQNWTDVSRYYLGDKDVTRSHADQHLLVFDRLNPDVVYVANDGGVYRSTNTGNTWLRVHSALPITQFYSVEVDQTRPFRVYGGTQDNYTQGAFGASDFTMDWKKVLDGDGFYVVVDNVNPNIIYGEMSNGDLYRINTTNPDNLAPRSIDRGLEPGYWATPMAMSPITNKLYTARKRVYRAANPRSGTPVWDTLTPGNTYLCSAIGLSALDSNKLIIGTMTGEIHYTLDGGKTWRRSTGSPNRFVSDLVYDSTRIYATFSGFGIKHVYRSDDHGATFKDISGNLPDIPVNAIEFDPTNSKRLFVGTDIGVFVTLDGGNVWFPFNEGLPVTPVTDMKLHRSSGQLIAATHGRSMFRIRIDNIQTVPLLIAPAGGENFSVPDTLVVEWAGFDVPVNVFMSSEQGAPYILVAANVTGNRVTIDLPLVKTTTARIKVQEVSGTRSVVSGLFSLTPTPNFSSIGSRGFVAEAIAIRGDMLWATSRGNDTIYRLKVPLLTARTAIVRKGIPGTVRALTYDPRQDVFYALVTDANYNQPRVYRMDTNGVGREVMVPNAITAATGIAMTPQGLAVVTPGMEGQIYVINPETGEEVSVSALEGAAGDQRRGLIWNDEAYVQGVIDAESSAFATELQLFGPGDPAVVQRSVPVIVSAGTPVIFFGLAMDANPDRTARQYYATDTAGIFYRFKGSVVSGVETGMSPVTRVGAASIDEVSPNPFRRQASVMLTLEKRQGVTLDLFTSSGERVLRIEEGVRDAGRHTITMRADNVPSGVYYLTLSTESGDRIVKPVVIVQ